MINDYIKGTIKDHAEKEFPKECCGILIVFKGRLRYIPCTNMSTTNNSQFSISSEEYMAAEDLGEVLAIVHSHPQGSSQASQADLVGCENSALPWIIFSWPQGEFNIINPSGYVAPLVGREYHYGILDCQSIVADYYKDKFNITLSTEPHPPEGWWDKGENRFFDGYIAAGFIVVDKPKAGDVVFMRVGSSQVANHVGVLLEDGSILHHQYMKLSSKDVYGGWYRKHTVYFMRHRSLI